MRDTTKNALEQNNLAYISLFCGLASLLPLVILVTFVPALSFGTLGLARSVRRPGRPGRQAALLGIAFALLGLVWQTSVVALGGLVGFLAN